MEYLQDVLKGLISGILAGYLIIYGLRPSMPYPEIILDFFENKWIFLILLIVNYYVFVWDYKCGVMLLMCIIALVFDYVIFAENDHKINLNDMVDFFGNKEPTFTKKVKNQ